MIFIFSWFTDHKCIILLISEQIIIVRENRQSMLCSNISSLFFKDDISQFEDCNSGKDLSKSERYDQLVKHKDTEMYLWYIYL